MQVLYSKTPTKEALRKRAAARHPVDSKWVLITARSRSKYEFVDASIAHRSKTNRSALKRKKKKKKKKIGARGRKGMRSKEAR